MGAESDLAALEEATAEVPPGETEAAHAVADDAAAGDGAADEVAEAAAEAVRVGVARAAFWYGAPGFALPSGGFTGGGTGPWRGGMVSAQYLRGARRGGRNLLAGRSKILGEGGNENLYPPPLALPPAEKKTRVPQSR